MVANSDQGKRLFGEKTVLRAKHLTDAGNDFLWATDDNLTRLDATEPYPYPLDEYLANYPAGIKDLTKMQFAIETTEGRHIGNCTCYNIDAIRREAELGILIGDYGYWGKGYGTDAVRAFMRYIFEELGMRRISLHTLDWNIRAVRCFRKCGFVECGRIMRQDQMFIEMEAAALNQAGNET